MSATALRQKLLDLGNVPPVPVRPVLVQGVRHLVDREPVDRESCRRRLQREPATGRGAEHVGRPTGLRDECLEIFDLALDGIGWRVAALAAASPRVAVDREAVRLRQERRVLRAVDDRPTYQDQRRSPYVALVRDRRAVLRGHTIHDRPPPVW